MLINGLQTLTLLDYPGRVACTVFTGGCNLRCPFCHNGSLVLHPDEGEQIPEESFFELLKKRRGVLEGVCITGGEPTMAFGLEPFMAKIKELGFLVKLDTNGTRPRAIRRILDVGLADMIAMDIKNSLEKYPLTCGVPGFDTAPVRESISLIMQSGVSHEFRTTVVRELHTPEDIRSIARLIQGAEGYFLQPYRDSGDILRGGCTRHTDNELRALLSAAREYMPNAELRGVELL